MHVAFGHAHEIGRKHVVAAPVYRSGTGDNRQAGCSQTHVVLGFPTPSLKDDYQPSVVAAGLFGEGMSSPLLDQVRERRGLVYYAACSTDLGGQFVIEASTAPEQFDELFSEVMRLLAAQTGTTDPVGLGRARNQIAVRNLRREGKAFLSD